MDLLAWISIETVQGWIGAGGYLVLFGLLFACGLGLPLPEDVPLILGGYFISQGRMHLAAVAIFAWLGIIGGDCVLYSLGKRFGLEITRVPFVGKHVTRERIVWAEQLFERYGTWVVAIGRMVAGVRGAMVIAAGATRFSFVKFFIADGLAAMVSGGLFVWLGWFLGRRLGSPRQILTTIEPYQTWVIAGVLLLILGFIFYLWWKRKTHHGLSDIALAKVAARTTQSERSHKSATSPRTGPTPTLP